MTRTVELTQDERNLVLQLLQGVTGNLLNPECPKLLALVRGLAKKLQPKPTPKRKR